ncbi:IS3 family transposase [Neobacillus sp. GCM10023253]|uniref:IS3 family transposase n=1 Tax=Neobacillus sp. GCM10023253 TaxID=3252644 RepID=UPI003609E345
MAKSAYTAREKYELIMAYEDRQTSARDFCSQHNISRKTIERWIYLYCTYGMDGLQEATGWKRYSKEVKTAAVLDYLSGAYSLTDVIQKYEISSHSVLEKWIRNYNDHRELKDTQRMSNSMIKGRSTSLEERLEIVMYCLQNGKNYNQASEHFKVSYQQVYQWVKKYEKEGETGLKDNRGRSKSDLELTTEEKIQREMKRLEQENERLRAEKCILKKVRGTRKEAFKEASLSHTRFTDKYVAIQELHKEENFSIVLLCEIARISRAAYYKWRDRSPSENEKLNEEILKEIIHLYNKVDGIYGYRRITMNLNRSLPKAINHKRVYRLMGIAGLQAIIRRKRKNYKPSTPQHVAENVLNRDFNAEKPNEKWLTDVTEMKFGASQKAYLSAILDLHDGSIVSFVLGTSNNNPLVFKTLDLALEANPGACPLLHSDRGFQYTSPAFKRKIEKAKMVQSMSRVGRCIDNGPMEAFWGTLKCEKYYLNKYSTFEELKKDIEDYINFYNYERLQKRLNGLSPLEYRAKAA